MQTFKKYYFKNSFKIKRKSYNLGAQIASTAESSGNTMSSTGTQSTPSDIRGLVKILSVAYAQFYGAARRW